MTRVEITPGGCILGALLVLVVPLPWLLGGLCAGIVHELCHLAALYCCHARVWSLRIGALGAAMEVQPLPPFTELCCAAAGPAGSLLLAVLARKIPEVALCALAQGLFNLIPLYPLDGGRMLRCVLLLVFPVWGERIAGAAEKGIWAAFLGLFLFHSAFCPDHLAVFIGILTIRLILGKISCKQGGNRVQ